ncbi:MAG: helix-turn-helix domain-containing protein [Phycisphaerae bacterium]|nr:helix-turn-helix domain-containing protein [Phycisphaerae bacterium]
MAKEPAKKPASEICRRIAELRQKTAGPRGKSAFAKQLGISPSTYDYYEGARVPPADILVRIAEVTGADLRWLLTGQAGAAPLAAEDHPVLRRAARLLADCPDASGPLGAFVDLLIEARKFPAKPAQQTPAAADAPTDTDAGREAWIPILGRTAAGVARFWGKGEDVSGLTMLADLVARWAGESPGAVRAAVAAEGESQPSAGVQLVTLSAPDDRDAVEFVAAGAIKRRYPDAFALRVDGDSMAPEIGQGDVVVLSPSEAAVEGRAAVVQLAGQIGVTCKLYRASGGSVHLVPVNGRYEIAAVPASQVEWALRVLARVRG